MFRGTELLVYTLIVILALNYFESNEANAAAAPEPCEALLRELMEMPPRRRKNNKRMNSTMGDRKPSMGTMPEPKKQNNVPNGTFYENFTKIMKELKDLLNGANPPPYP